MEMSNSCLGIVWVIDASNKASHCGHAGHLARLRSHSWRKWVGLIKAASWSLSVSWSNVNKIKAIMNAISPSWCHKDFQLCTTAHISETLSPHMRNQAIISWEEETYCSDLVRSSCSSLLSPWRTSCEGGRTAEWLRAARVVQWPVSAATLHLNDTDSPWQGNATRTPAYSFLTPADEEALPSTKDGSAHPILPLL